MIAGAESFSKHLNAYNVVYIDLNSIYANWHGDLLFVGVNYDEKSKEHSCKIERFVKE